MLESATSPVHRCRYLVHGERVLERNGPTGFRNGRYGILQSRICVDCGANAPRWKPGIDTSSQIEALDLNRPTDEKEWRRINEREIKLAAIASANGFLK